MKRLLTSTALVVAMAVPALAQDSGDTTASPYLDSANAADLRASEFIGTRVFTSETDVEPGNQTIGDNWNGIGEINDVLLTADGNIDAILVDVGGFLGIGEKTVAVSMDQLQLMSDGDDADDYFVVFTSSREALENAPEYVEPEMAAATNTGLETGETTDPLANDTAAMTDPTVHASEDMAASNDSEGTAAHEALTTDMSNDPALAEGNTAPEAPDATAQMAETGSGFAAPDIQRDGFAEAKADVLNTETLTGARVYDVNDEWIGEVAELLVDDSGKITDAVIEVGGFLGMGEKPVSMNFDSLNIQQQTDGEELRVYLNATEEELESLPRYEEVQ